MSKLIRIRNNFSSIRFQRLSREFFWVGIGQALSATGAIIGVRLLTSVLSPISYGELALGMTLAMLTQQVIFGPFAMAILRFYAPAQEARQLPACLKAIRILLLPPTVILLSLSLALGVVFWGLGQTVWLRLLAAATVFALLHSFCSALSGIQNAARQRVIVAWHDGLGQWMRYFGAVVFVILLGAFSQSAMLGFAAASAVVLISQSLFFRHKVRGMVDSQMASQQVDIEKWTKQMQSYAMPFAVWGIFTWAQLASDRWALKVFVDNRSIGLYAVLYQLGYYPVILLSGLMLQFITPVLFSWAGDGSDPERMVRTRRLNKAVFLGSVLLALLGTALAFLFHRQIFSLLVAPAYQEVSSLLPVMILAGGLFASGQAASLLLMSGLKTKRLMAPKIVTALWGVLLNFASAYWFGLRGVVFASVGFSLAYLVWILCLARPLARTELSRREVRVGELSGRPV